MLEVDYVDAAHNYEGYCAECDSVTATCCEPDAYEYECPVCGNNSVYGMEEALIMGMIVFD